MKLETAKMLRNIGMHYFYNNKVSHSIYLIKLALDISTGINDEDLLFEYHSDLGQMYYYDHSYKHAKNTLESVEYLIPRVRTKEGILCDYYYRLGNVFFELGKYETARKHFQQSISYTQNKLYISRATMDIGITYKREKLYDKALHYYRTAYEYIGDSDYNSKCIIDNNIAELYRVLGKYDEAMKYINSAFSYLDYTNLLKKFITTLTYTQIMIARGEPSEAIDKLFELINKCQNSFTYKKHIIEGFEIIVNYCIDSKDNVTRKRCESSLYKLIDKTTKEKDYNKELKVLLCNIYMNKKKRGEIE